MACRAFRSAARAHRGCESALDRALVQMMATANAAFRVDIRAYGRKDPLPGQIAIRVRDTCDQAHREAPRREGREQDRAETAHEPGRFGPEAAARPRRQAERSGPFRPCRRGLSPRVSRRRRPSRGATHTRIRVARSRTSAKQRVVRDRAADRRRCESRRASARPADAASFSLAQRRQPTPRADRERGCREKGLLAALGSELTRSDGGRPRDE